MYKILLSCIFVLSFSANAADHQSGMSQCRKSCDPETCAHYSLEKAFQCIEDCGKEDSIHAETVVQRCQNRVDQLMTHEEQKAVFPDVCGNATKEGAVLNLVPIEGVIVGSGKDWKFEGFSLDSHGADVARYQISPKVGHIGTGKPHGDINLLSRTPPGFAVMAHVDVEKKMVMCLSTAYKP